MSAAVGSTPHCQYEMFTPHNSDAAIMIRLEKHDGDWLSAETCLCSIFNILSWWFCNYAQDYTYSSNPYSASFTRQTL